MSVDRSTNKNYFNPRQSRLFCMRKYQKIRFQTLTNTRTCLSSWVKHFVANPISKYNKVSEGIFISFFEPQNLLSLSLSLSAQFIWQFLETYKRCKHRRFNSPLFWNFSREIRPSRLLRTNEYDGEKVLIRRELGRLAQFLIYKSDYYTSCTHHEIWQPLGGPFAINRGRN